MPDALPRRIAAAALRPPWRTILLLAALLAAGGIFWAVWTPGLALEDGRHDRGRNGIWLSHGWLGADAWFKGREGDIPRFREPAAIEALAARLRDAHITDAFPHLAPAEADGSLPPADDAQVERLLAAMAGDGGRPIRVIPWIGGVLGRDALIHSPRWREGFVASVLDLLERHPGLAGVQINIEPLPSGEQAYILLLETLREKMPGDRLLSVAAYPPPIPLNPAREVYWDTPFIRRVADPADQLAFMLYDTGLKERRLYISLLELWLWRIFPAVGPEADVLLGLPAYDDAGVPWHDPAVENLESGLLGIHAGLTRLGALPDTYQGAALYSGWELDEGEWALWRRGFMAPEGR